MVVFGVVLWCYKTEGEGGGSEGKKSGEWDKRVAYEFFLLNPK